MFNGPTVFSLHHFYIINIPLILQPGQCVPKSAIYQTLFKENILFKENKPF